MSESVGKVNDESPSASSSASALSAAKMKEDIREEEKSNSHNNSNNNRDAKLRWTFRSMADWPPELRNLTAGGLAGMVAKSVVAPLDRLKILVQVSAVPFRLKHARHIIREILQKEGPTALWKGHTATLLRVFPYAGIQFMVYDKCKAHFLLQAAEREQQLQQLNVPIRNPTIRHMNNSSTSSNSTCAENASTIETSTNDDDETLPTAAVVAAANENSGNQPASTTNTTNSNIRLTPLESLGAGMLAGTASVLATYPLDLTRAQMAVDQSTATKNNIAVGGGGSKHDPTNNSTTSSRKLSVRNILRNLYQNRGLAGLFRGVGPTLLGILPYSGIAFALNEQGKREIMEWSGRSEVTTVERMQCGALAGLVAQSVTYPLEVTRRRMQTIGLVASMNTVNVNTNTVTGSSSDGALPTLGGTIRHLYTEQGIRGFFKGVSMNWMKGPIAFSISFTTFDILQKQFQSMNSTTD